MKINAFFIVLLLVAITTYGAANAQSPVASGDSLKTITGKWAGTFDGPSTGKFELVINQDGNRKLSGQVIMLADDGNRYPADLKTIVWQNGKLSASYLDGDGEEVSFTGNYANPALKGTWKTQDGQVSGTWQASR